MRARNWPWDFIRRAPPIFDNEESQNQRDEQNKEQGHAGNVKIECVNPSGKCGSAGGYKWNPGGLHSIYAAPPAGKSIRPEPRRRSISNRPTIAITVTTPPSRIRFITAAPYFPVAGS